MKTGLRIFITFLIVLLVDGLTKIWAEQAISSPTPILGQFFRLTLGYNTGVSFGLLTNGGLYPLIITGTIITGLIVWLVMMIRKGEIPAVIHVPIGFILGGAIANFVDRMLDGRVTDFLDFGWGPTRWPTFNLADSFIVVGVLLLLFILSRIKSPEKEQAL